MIRCADYAQLLKTLCLEWAYPRLKKWHEWWLADRGDGQPWRDGNRDGLLEWGSDRGSTPSVGGRGTFSMPSLKAAWTTVPCGTIASYDPRTYTMNLDDVGLNSLYTLDAECLAKIAAILGKEEDSRKFAAEYERMKQLVREKLWNEKDGIYENRFWDGRFSPRLSPTNFYPMFAGIATPEQAERMIKEHLLNPKEFWGNTWRRRLLATIRPSPTSFTGAGTFGGRPTTCSTRASIVTGSIQVALEYAQKNYDLFMDDWRTNQHDNEQYYAWGGTGGGDPHYTWGALLCLVAAGTVHRRQSLGRLAVWRSRPAGARRFPSRGLGESPLRHHPGTQ